MPHRLIQPNVVKHSADVTIFHQCCREKFHSRFQFGVKETILFHSTEELSGASRAGTEHQEEVRRGLYSGQQEGAAAGELKALAF